MQHIIEFISNWGYVAVLFGSMIEGESIILAATFMAYNGYLSLPKIMIIAFLGTLFADQALYYLGRYYGTSLIQRYPRLHHNAHRAFRLLHRWDTWFILTFRFIYGIRIISPVVIGAGGIPPNRFIPLNLIAAIIWTVISCMGGYMLGEAVEKLIEHFHTFQYYATFVLVAVAILGGIGIWWKTKKSRTSYPSTMTPFPSPKEPFKDKPTVSSQPSPNPKKKGCSNG